MQHDMPAWWLETHAADRCLPPSSSDQLGSDLTSLKHLPVQGDGPIALVMAPTRELIVQIGKDINRFARSANIRCVCVYGGTGVGSQVSLVCGS